MIDRNRLSLVDNKSNALNVIDSGFLSNYETLPLKAVQRPKEEFSRDNYHERVHEIK
jgi:hypothetical protein